LGPGALVEKVQPRTIEETTVHGLPALWAEGEYLLQLKNGSYEVRRLVEGNTLIWTEDSVTYRLESSQTLPETVQIAESLK
jgi:hypothetical protein